MKKPSPFILIIDDNTHFINRMTGLLKEVSIGAIESAETYQDALRKLEARRPDVILLDINLPGKNGVELLKRIRQDYHQIPVIMISNHANEYYRKICMDLGVEHFLDKSNEFGLVSGIIRKMNFN